TASQYSKNAIPQLIIMTRGSGLSLNFRCPYQAKVMKTFEQNSIRIVRSHDGIVNGMISAFGMAGGKRRLLAACIRVKRRSPMLRELLERQSRSCPARLNSRSGSMARP